MKFFNSFHNQWYQFFTKEEREDCLEMQPVLNNRVLQLISSVGGKPDTLKSVEFFFYSDEQDKANNLVIELNKQGYTLYGVGAPEHQGQEWSIIGCTPPMVLEEKELNNWSEKMLQLGYECDCKFDGWGTLVE